MKGELEGGTSYTLDGTVDLHGQPAIRERTGRWVAGTIILRKLQFIIAVVIIIVKTFINYYYYYDYYIYDCIIIRIS